MPVVFNDLISAAGIDLATTRFVRHQDSANRGRHPYDIWRNAREGFDSYQRAQSTKNRALFAKAAHWASFVATPAGETLFVGLYAVRYLGPNQNVEYDISRRGEPTLPGEADYYELTRLDALADLEGRLTIEWGLGFRAWVQRADSQTKNVLEIRPKFKEPDFPGYSNLSLNLSGISRLPTDWITPLKAARGIYLLACPRTSQLYVGAAYGEDGFYGRWSAYAADGHGGNILLRGREPSDFEVSILETAASTASVEDILAREELWKKRLRTRNGGLNGA